MEFGLDESQRSLADMLERFLAERCPVDTVRAVCRGDEEARGALAADFSSLGLAGLLVPQAYGGAGLGLLDAVVVQTALGRHVAPLPFMTWHALAPLAFAEAQEDGETLAAVASGRLRAAVGIAESAGARAGYGVSCVDGRLTGRAGFVLGFDGATDVLVADQAGAVFMAPADSPGVEATPVAALDVTRPMHDIRFSAVPARETGRRGSVVRLLAGARVLLAADALGAAQRMLEMAVEYAGERHQFGRPVGSFQAVKHLCAEMAAALEPCHALTWQAAHARDTAAPDADLVTLLAKSHVAEISRDVARKATEVHGGIGFTDALGLHLWFKRIGFDRQYLGGPERLREAAARLQGWTVPGPPGRP